MRYVFSLLIIVACTASVLGQKTVHVFSTVNGDRIFNSVDIRFVYETNTGANVVTGPTYKLTAITDDFGVVTDSLGILFGELTERYFVGGVLTPRSVLVNKRDVTNVRLRSGYVIVTVRNPEQTITVQEDYATTLDILGYWTEGGGGSGSLTSLGYVNPPAGLNITGTNPATTTATWTFALANDLAAVEGLSGTGIAVRTASDTWTTRSLVEPAAGIVIADADGVSGNPTFDLANDLAALEAQSNTGFMVRSAPETYDHRIISSGTGIGVTFGDGIAGDPIIEVDTTLIATVHDVGITQQRAWAEGSISTPTYSPTLSETIFHNGPTALKEDTLHYRYNPSLTYNTSEVGLYIKHISTSTSQAPAIHIRSYGPGTGNSNQNIPMITMEMDSFSAPSATPFTMSMNYVDAASSAGDNYVFNMGLNLSKQGTSLVAGQPSLGIQWEGNYAAATSADIEWMVLFNPSSSGAFRPIYATANRVDGSGSVFSTSANTHYFTNGPPAQDKGVWGNDEFVIKNPSTNGNFFLTVQGNGTGTSSIRMRRPTDATNYNALSIANATSYLQLSDSYLDVKVGADVFSMDHANYGNAIISARYNSGSPNDTLDFGHFPGFGENYISHSNYRFTLSDGAAVYVGVYGSTVTNYAAIGQTNANDFFIHTTRAITTTEVAFGIDRSTGNVGISKIISDIDADAALQVGGKAQIDDFSGTTTKLSGISSTNTLTDVIIGTGLSLSGDTLYASGGTDINIYEDDGNVQDGGTIVDVSGNDPIILALDNAGGENNRVLRMTADYAADDATTNWLVATTGSDSLKVVSYDDGLYLGWEGITGAGEGFVISSNTVLDLRADSILMSTVPAKNVLQFITGLYGNTISKIEGSVTGQVIVWDETANYWKIGSAVSPYYHTIRDDGTDKTQRGYVNFVSGSIVSATVTDDGANDESEVSFGIVSNSISNTEIGTNAVNSDELADNGVADIDIRQSAGLSVIGRSANSTGNVADITAATDNNVLRRSGTSIGWGAINLASSDAVTGLLPVSNLAAGAFIQDGNTLAATAVMGTNDANALSFEVNNTVALTIGTSYDLTATAVVANTNTAASRLVIRTNSSGSVANSFGGGILFQGESTTSDNQDMARLIAQWTTATHASREAKLSIELGDGGGALAEIAHFNRVSSTSGALSIGSASPAIYMASGITTAQGFTIGNSTAAVTIGGASGTVNIGGSSGAVSVYSTNAAGITLTMGTGNGVTLINNNAQGTTGWHLTVGSTIKTSSSYAAGGIKVAGGYTPDASGSGTWKAISVENSIDQTVASANGETWGLNINPTLTSIRGTYYAVDIVPNTSSAKGIYQRGSLSTNNFVGNTLVGGTGTPNSQFHVTDDVAATNAAATVITVDASTTGTVDNGFGPSVLYRGESSTTADQTMGTESFVWKDKTHASRTADWVLSNVNNTTLTETMRMKGTGVLQFPTTITGAGTTGNQTIDKMTGTVNFAAAATSLTVTNALVTTSSIVLAIVRTNDTTAYVKNVVPGAGSFVINLGAAATAETSVGFIVINN